MGRGKRAGVGWWNFWPRLKTNLVLTYFVLTPHSKNVFTMPCPACDTLFQYIQASPDYWNLTQQSEVWIISQPTIPRHPNSTLKITKLQKTVRQSLGRIRCSCMHFHCVVNPMLPSFTQSTKARWSAPKPQYPHRTRCLQWKKYTS
jgi:hypothetical protein